MTMPLVAWDADGAIVQVSEQTMARVPGVGIVGEIDLAAHERDGGALTDIFVAHGAVGAGTWPEHLGARFGEFRVELEPDWTRARHAEPYRIRALIHRSGHRRERPDGVGGSLHRPLSLDAQGRNAAEETAEVGSPAHLPLVTPKPEAA